MRKRKKCDEHLESPKQLENNFNRLRKCLFNVKLLIILFLTMQFPLDEIENPHGRLEKYFEMDIDMCPQCFITKSNMCTYLNENFQFIFDNIIDIINLVVGTKSLHVGQLKSSQHKIVAKHSEKWGLYSQIKEIIETESRQDLEDRLKELFHIRSERQGFYFCNQLNLEFFIDRMTKFTSSRTETWMHLLVNVETVLLAALNNYTNLPVSKYYGHCGFTHYQSYNGRTLNEWNQHNISYLNKLKISVKILLGAASLSFGFDSYRLYFTDLTLDNIVYDDHNGNVTFIDLDSVIIVDGNPNRSGEVIEPPLSPWNYVHSHEEIECDGCFAYRTEDLCTHHLSDINIFSVCQLLNEDLHGNERGGYLKPIPLETDQAFPTLREKLHECVRCPSHVCQNRFQMNEQLIQILSEIINTFDII